MTNDISWYVNAKSNHSPSILKEIPKSVSKPISSNSCNEQVSNASGLFYNNILDKYGYSEKLTLTKNSSHMKEEIEQETLPGTMHHLVKMLKPILQNNFYTYWKNILVEIINITTSSIATMSKLVIVTWIIWKI